MTHLRLGRRQLVWGLGTLALLPTGCTTSAGTWWVSAQGDDAERFSLLAASPAGPTTNVPSGFRGHGLAVHPQISGRVVMFARRPGTEGLVVDLGEPRSATSLACRSGLRMQGHGAFSPDGQWLFGTLADEATGAGALGVWRTDSWAQVDELPTQGIGPHEVRLMPDGRTLVVANGGLLTRPETGREVLNLDTMDSSIVFVDIDSGEVNEQARVGVPKASLRHLDITDDGVVVVGAQIQRAAVGHDDVLPLVAAHRPSTGLVAFDTPDLVAAMADYVGSVTLSSRSRIAATSSPRGNLVLFWDIDRGALVGQHAFTDVSGLAVDEAAGTFVLTNSFGQVRTLDAFTLAEDESARRDFDDVRWDNHLTLVTS
ncbi:MAG: DUF1513 domain-containing protein [Myxococcota bacterium]